jgi:hypothetical protein
MEVRHAGIAVCVAAALVIAGDPPAAAQQKRITLDLTSLSDEAINARTEFLERRLDGERRGAQFWHYGWGAFNGASMLATAALAATDDNRKDRNTDIVQSAQSLVGVLNVFLRPLPALSGADPVRAMPGETREERIARLAAAEDLVSRGADRAHEPYELGTQAGALGFNLLAGLVIWQVADFRHAWQSTIPGVVVGEIQLFTQPWQPADDLNAYRTEFAPGHAINWRVSPRPTGFEVSVNF